MPKTWSIKGGVHPDFHKLESTGSTVKIPSLPEMLVIPVRQMSGPVEDFKVLITKGDYVLKGQPMIACDRCTLHAPTSGTIIAIEDRPVPHPSGLGSRCIILDADGKEEWHDEIYEPYPDYDKVNVEHLLTRVREAGVVGLGGAVFPTKIKLGAAAKAGLKTFIVNAAECEPYITSDDMLMREKADEVITGIRIMQHVLKPERCLIGIEDNKPEAIAALKEALGGMECDGINIVPIPTIYPSGDEKQLIRILTGQKIPPNTFAAESGFLVHNVATVHSIYDAIVKGKPLLSRNVTVTGNGVKSPQNFHALIGTPFSHLIKEAGGYTDSAERLTMGGPMMGFQMQSDDVSVVKATNCILVGSVDTSPYSTDLAMPCIRCGKCAEVCPVDLLPQQLYWYARAEDTERAEEHHLFNCIECGCCSYVCPSNIPLVQYYRHAKSLIRDLRQQKVSANIARERHEFRDFRKQRDKEERDAKRAAHKKKVQQKTASSTDKQAAIKAAMERAKAKKLALAEKKIEENN